MHFFQGLFIRSLNGEIQGNMSTLIIDSCSYQDAGEYSCIAWNELKRTRLYANKTVTLAVNSEYSNIRYKCYKALRPVTLLIIFVVEKKMNIHLQAKCISAKKSVVFKIIIDDFVTYCLLEYIITFISF